MKYALLIHADESLLNQLPRAEHQARLDQHRRLQEDAASRGHYDGAVRLAPTDSSVRVVTRGQEQVLTDGPFPETKEHLLGLYVIASDSLEQAIEYARRIPVAPYGTIEVRPIVWQGSRAELPEASDRA